MSLGRRVTALEAILGGRDDGLPCPHAAPWIDFDPPPEQPRCWCGRRRSWWRMYHDEDGQLVTDCPMHGGGIRRYVGVDCRRV
jgi:hypothetical protein